MKLLFDQNLSFKLVGKLAHLYPNSNQLRVLRLDREDDRVIWDYARNNDFVMVTQDVDYSNLSALLGYPPKVIWLRCGNRPTNFIESLLAQNHVSIVQFLNDSTVGCLEIGSQS